MRIAIEWVALDWYGIRSPGPRRFQCRTPPSVVANFAMSAVPNLCESLLIPPRLVTEGIVVALLMAILVFSILPSFLVSSNAIIVTYILILWVTVAFLLKSIVAGFQWRSGLLDYLLLRFAYHLIKGIERVIEAFGYYHRANDICPPCRKLVTAF